MQRSSPGCKFVDKAPSFKEQLINRFADLYLHMGDLLALKSIRYPCYLTKTLNLHAINSELLISFPSDSVVFVRPKFTARPCKKNRC